MKKKILIVQSLERWTNYLKKAFKKEFPQIADEIIYTDSFDHALDIIPIYTELIVICSNMFHDSFSEHADKVKEKLPTKEKSGDSLARLIKEINPLAKVYVFSEYPPSGIHIDGFLFKKYGDRENNIAKAVNLIKEELNIK